MSHDGPECTVGDIVRETGGHLRVLGDSEQAAGMLLSSVRFLTQAALTSRASPSTATTLWVPLRDEPTYPDLVRRALAEPLPGAIVVWLHAGLTDDEVRASAPAGAILVADPELGSEQVLEAAGRAARAGEDALTRRLTSLQRALTQALSAPLPLSDLVGRLARTCNAAVCLVDEHGAALHATGPVPLSLLLAELNRTADDARTFAVDGWHGVGVRVPTPGLRIDKGGWLLAASRRSTFPDAYSVAAVHVAASLAETAARVDMLAQRQELAVRSSLLEQVLAMRLERHDAELAGKVAALGFSFDQEVRAVVIQLPHGRTRPERSSAAESLQISLRTLLLTQDVPHLLSMRDVGLVGIVQAPIAALRRWLVDCGAVDQIAGIGRDADSLGQAVDSYHDAQLALRALVHDANTSARVMAYEDFDFATRLFSDVGLEKMTDWANKLLGPIQGQPILIDGLRRFFEHNMNTISAAESLNVHHNSLRYRLSKIEELLGLSLRDPSAISSLYLALTAHTMGADGAGNPTPPSRTRRAAQPGVTRSSDATNAVDSDQEPGYRTWPGVALGPEP